MQSHDEREWWRPYVAAVEVARASCAERTQNSYYSAHQAEVGEWTAPRDPMPEGAGAAAVRIPITPGWDLRPGADLPHFDRLIRLTPKTLLGWVSKITAVVVGAFASQSPYMLRLCIVAGAIVTAFGLGWFCGWTSGSSPTAGAETLSRTATSSPEKRDVAITGSVASNAPTLALTSQDASISPADSLKASLIATQVSAQPPHTALVTAQQAIISTGPGAAQSDLKSEPRLKPAPETRPATIAGWTIREVHGGTAVLVGRDHVWTVRLGDYVPGVGRIDAITRWGRRWIVVTTNGLISTR
jgi:hypothetical protein